MTAGRLVVLAGLAALVAACASDANKSEEPAELKAIHNTASVQRVWKSSAGSGEPRLRLGLSLAVDADAIYAASHDGVITAFSKTNGRRLWSTNTKLSLTGGPGAGDGLVVAGASHGKLVALDAATGAIKWNSFINSEVLSAPAIANDIVVLRAVDGRVAAFSASDGAALWSAEQQVPRLSLRGTSRPLIAGDQVFVGFDNGRVQALQLKDGITLWDVNLAPSSGKTELERLNDIDTVMQVHGDHLYVVTFQGKVASLDLATGDLQWSRDESSYSGLAADDSGVYITNTGGVISRITPEGIEAWRNEALAWRKLSPPGLTGDLIATADYEGYVHFLDRATGNEMARIRPLADRVSADPVVSDGVLFMLDVAGNVVALRTGPAGADSGKTTIKSEEAQTGTISLRPR